MSRDDQFIQQLESYLDDYEGLTPLPDNVRDAVRAAIPSTRQTGPNPGLTRYFTMSLSTPAQLALGAAAVILAVVVGAALLGPNVGAPPATPSPSEGAAASATPAPTSDPCDGEIVSVPATGTLAIAWCPPQGDGSTAVAFTMAAPADWADQAFGGSQALYLRPSGGGALAVAVGGAESVDAWVDSITGTEAYLVSEPQTVSIGGADGYVMDVSLAPGADPAQAPPLFEDSDLPWRINDQDPVRVWVIDHDGQPLMIVAGPATPADFDAWTSAVGDALATIEWGR